MSTAKSELSDAEQRKMSMQPIAVTAAARAVESIGAMVRERFPQAQVAWKAGSLGLELKVSGAKFPRVGRLFVLDLAPDVASIRHKWPGHGEFRFNTLAGWAEHMARKAL